MTEELNLLISNALKEDIREGDHTSLACIPDTANGRAMLLAKENGYIAGVEVAKLIFSKVDPDLKVNVFIKDGNPIKIGDTVLEVEGSSISILTAERLVLNCMQRMSAIATKTKYIYSLISETNAKVLDTRKTTPNFRLLEKLAVKIGGGTNHRFGLFDMMMIKDNHIDFAGGIKFAIQKANKYQTEKGINIPIEIEARNISEVIEILSVGKIQRIMLDNFSIEDTKKAVKLINGKFQTESSGGITEDTIGDYAKCGVDFISVGALTHSIKSLDLSLKAIK